MNLHKVGALKNIRRDNNTVIENYLYQYFMPNNYLAEAPSELFLLVSTRFPQRFFAKNNIVNALIPFTMGKKVLNVSANFSLDKSLPIQ